ncbi:hypothetical protein RNJ44_01224 [Nakaseomyces bracarensis]|uniref:PX domain-containing protein n=1 Tax=Nakaseomyces bracarensis TaxID=273131 RepID=A0ABR4NR91_9SACH
MVDNGAVDEVDKDENSTDLLSTTESLNSKDSLSKKNSKEELDDSVFDDNASDGHMETEMDEETEEDSRQTPQIDVTRPSNESYEVNIDKLDHLFSKRWKRRRPIKVGEDTVNGYLSNALSSRLDISSLPASLQSSHYILTVELPPLSYSMPFDEIEYNITYRTSESPDSTVTVYRTLEHIYVLYRQLQNNNWGKIVPPPPLKECLPERNDITQREVCCFQIKRMLEEIISDSILSADTDFQLFLNSDNFEADAKKREQVTGSMAFDKTLPLSASHVSLIKLFGPQDGKEIIMNGGLESEYKGIFSFSSVPTYIENDESIVRANQRINILQKQFTNILESFEQIRRQRSELSSVLDEFTKTVIILADDELNKHCADVLRKFASNHEEMNRYLNHISIEEFHALYLNIDNFLRYCQSANATLDQRHTLGTYIEIINSQLRKVESNIEKFQNGSLLQFKSQEKKEQSEKVHAILLKRKAILEEKFNTITNKILHELKVFYADRATYFKNSMGAYITGILETQSRNNSMWEKFSL